MKRAGFQIGKIKLLGSIMFVSIVLVQFLGCGESNIVIARRTPQGTYGCPYGTKHITCPECSGSGKMKILTGFGKKGSVSNLEEKEIDCIRCSGVGFLCKKEESIASTASPPSGSYEEEKIRDGVHMVSSLGQFVLIDRFDAPAGDVFYVAAVRRPGESAPAKIPGDAIEYALTEFVGLRKDYMFFHRFASAIKEGLALKGQCLVECIYEGTPMTMRFIYRPGHKHLEVQVGGKSHAIDLGKTDISIDERKDKDSAIMNTKKAMPDSKFSKKAVIQTALLYRKEGKIEQGITYLNDVLKRIPDDPDLLLCLGVFYEETKEFEKAEIALKRGLELDPDNSRLHFRLGNVYNRWGREKAAIEEMKTVISLDPQNAYALNYLGYSYAESGENLDEAERLIKEALKQDPDNGYITDSLGWVYFKKGLFTEALKYLEKAASLVPDDPYILEHLGDTYLKRADYQEALNCYKHSLSKKRKDRGDLEKKIRDLTGK